MHDTLAKARAFGFGVPVFPAAPGVQESWSKLGDTVLEELFHRKSRGGFCRLGHESSRPENHSLGRKGRPW